MPTKEHPILSQGAMVRALLAGTKTQTRRAVKLGEIPPSAQFSGWQAYEGTKAAMFCWSERVVNGVTVVTGMGGMVCPYGQPGDRLWVRETFYAFGHWETRFNAKKGRDEWHFIDMTLECDKAYAYAADGASHDFKKGNQRNSITPAWWKRPAIFMPRAASRILLEVTAVRVERLQAISEADAIAEGIETMAEHDRDCRPTGRTLGLMRWPGDEEACWDSPCNAYAALWESINGAGGWAANPFVWVVEFRRAT